MVRQLAPTEQVYSVTTSTTNLNRCSMHGVVSSDVVHGNLGGGGGDARKFNGHCLFSLVLSKSINANYLINEASYEKYVCVRTFTGPKRIFVPGYPNRV